MIAVTPAREPRALLARREVHVGLGPAPRPVVLVAVEARGAEPVLHASSRESRIRSRRCSGLSTKNSPPSDQNAWPPSEASASWSRRMTRRPASPRRPRPTRPASPAPTTMTSASTGAILVAARPRSGTMTTDGGPATAGRAALGDGRWKEARAPFEEARGRRESRGPRRARAGPPGGSTTRRPYSTTASAPTGCTAGAATPPQPAWPRGSRPTSSTSTAPGRSPRGGSAARIACLTRSSPGRSTAGSRSTRGTSPTRAGRPPTPAPARAVRRRPGPPLRRAGSRDARARARGAALVASAEVTEGMRRLDEATLTALEGEATIPISGAWTCCFLVSACTAIRDHDRAFTWCDRIAEFAERYGSRYMLAFCRSEYGLCTSARAVAGRRGAARGLVRGLRGIAPRLGRRTSHPARRAPAPPGATRRRRVPARAGGRVSGAQLGRRGWRSTPASRVEPSSSPSASSDSPAEPRRPAPPRAGARRPRSDRARASSTRPRSRASRSATALAIATPALEATADLGRGGARRRREATTTAPDAARGRRRRVRARRRAVPGGAGPERAGRHAPRAASPRRRSGGGREPRDPDAPRGAGRGGPLRPRAATPAAPARAPPARRASARCWACWREGSRTGRSPSASSSASTRFTAT